MSGSIYLGGGGSEQDERLLWDEAFASAHRVVVWPFAWSDMDNRRRSGEWVASSLAERGDVEVDVWLGDAHDADELDGADVLAVPGGNTFDLLAFLQGTDWLPAAAEFVARGGRIYGGSAGALICGADIAIAGVADPNDAGVEDMRGLDLLSGAVVYPHFTPDATDVVEAWAHRLARTVVAIPEDAGVVVTGREARNVGPAYVTVTDPKATLMMRPGDTWVLGAA